MEKYKADTCGFFTRVKMTSTPKFVSTNLKSLFTLSIYASEEDRRMACIQLSVLSACTAVALFVICVDMIWLQSHLKRVLAAGLVLQIIPCVLLLRGRLLAGAFSSIALYILVTTALATTGGGLHDYVVMLYPVIIMLAGLTAQKRGLFFAALLVVGALAWLVFGEMYGWFSIDNSYAPDAADFIISMLLILLAMWAVYVLISNEQNGLAQVWRELSYRKQMEEKLRESEARLDLFFSQSLDGFFFMMLDEPVRWDETVDKEKALDYIFAHQRVTKINDAMLAQYKAERSQFLNLTPNDFFAHDIEQGRRVWKQFFDAGHLHIDTEERKFDGSPMWVEGDYICMYDAQGRITGHFGIQREITERKQAEQTLRDQRAEIERAHKMLELILETIPARVFWKDRGMVYLGCNAAFARDAGFDRPSDLLGKTDFDLWAEFAPMYRADDLQVMQTRQPKIGIIEQLLLAAGNKIWIATSKAPLINSEGEVFGVLGVYEDITERKAAEDALRLSNARYASLFKQSHDAVFLLDFEGRHMAANQRAADMLGYSIEELQKLSVREISAELDESNDVLKRLLSGEQIPLYERLFRKKNGEVFPVEINIEIVRDENGIPLHIQSIARDITERQRAAEFLQRTNEMLRQRIAEVEALQGELRRQAIHDSLTGLYNRRYLNETLKRDFARAKRESKPLAIVLLDLDDFKNINDKYGHPIGDKFLISFANLLKLNSRASDAVCRWGGEEFLLLLPDTDLRAALKYAEKLRAVCGSHAITHEGVEIQATVSIGVAAYPVHAANEEDLLVKADKALYSSKNTGKNKVTVYEPS